MAYVLRGWGLNSHCNLPALPHIPGSLYTRTFLLREGSESISSLPLYSWNFVTVVCPGCPWRAHTDLPVPLAAASQARRGNPWSSVPCLPAPESSSRTAVVQKYCPRGGPGRGRGAGGRIHARPPACLLRTADCLGWGWRVPLGATMGPVLGRASGQGGEVCTVGPEVTLSPIPPSCRGQATS